MMFINGCINVCVEVIRRKTSHIPEGLVNVTLTLVCNVAFGSDSVMNWERITDAHGYKLIYFIFIVHVRGVRYRDEILRRYVVPFIRRDVGKLQEVDATVSSVSRPLQSKPYR